MAYVKHVLVMDTGTDVEELKRLLKSHSIPDEAEIEYEDYEIVIKWDEGS